MGFSRSSRAQCVLACTAVCLSPTKTVQMVMMCSERFNEFLLLPMSVFSEGRREGSGWKEEEVETVEEKKKIDLTGFL